MVLENLPKPLRSMLFAILGVRWAGRMLRSEISETDGSNVQILTRLFKRNDFDMTINGLEQLPEVPCIVVGNHPHGLFDGLALLWLASQKGAPARAISRHFLAVFEPIKDFFLFIKLSKLQKAERGDAMVQQAADYIRQGGTLVITPAGHLSIATPLWSKAKDRPWRTGVARIAQQANAPIVMVHVSMADSMLRQLAHKIHPVLRAICQVWAFRFGKHQAITLSIVGVVQPTELPEGSSREQTEWLQREFDKRCEALTAVS